jgi:hypothetical protein
VKTRTIRAFALRFRAAAALAVVAFALAACGGSSKPAVSGPTTVEVTVAPSTATLAIGGVTLAFAATVKNSTDTSVTWQVNGVDGGDAAVGTISAAGLYMSPAAMPSSGSVSVTAVLVADTTKSGSADVTLSAATNVSVVVAPTTATVVVGGGTQVFTATVSNASNTAVTWQVNGSPGGNSTVGTISAAGLYTAPATLPAQHTVTVGAVSVEDPTKWADAMVTLTTGANNVMVAVSPTTANVHVTGSTQNFTATVTNATNTAVTWQVNGTTGGNSTVGTISASGLYTAPMTMPSPATVTVTAVSVQDPTKSASATVTITANPPTIGGTPGASVLVGVAYDFIPTATDPNALSLTFSITGKPAWATFNTSTGELSGTPAAADVGSSNITITASDGLASASLNFPLAVVAAATGSASLSWVAPTTRTDGSALTNLAGFRIYYGTSQTSLTNTVSVTNATVTTAVVSNLTSGTWYFAVTALDSSGNESDKSNIASKAI